MKTNKKNIVIVLLSLAVGLLLGALFFGGNGASEEPIHEHADENRIWTCSMHPEVRRSEPGDCPICGMELIPAGDGGMENEAVFQMSENAMKLANITTMTVGEGEAAREIQLNGKVVADERNTFSQSTHIPGRIEQLQINFTGEQVSRGQTLAVVYSPELVTAQEELLQAYSIRESQPELYAAAREKLRNWRIGENQIDQVISGGRALERFPITADVTGIVTEKMVELGDYVERGMPIYEISDLSQVWVLFDLYESQLAWIREGSEVEFSIASLPGETFTGEISFIDPLLNSQTRVATARVEVPNNDGRLKPEMFASGTVKTSIGEAGVNQIVVPKSAVLWTGKRSLVYIKEETAGRAGFQLREVVLGPSLGEAYIIEEGLEVGEEIVVNGTFTVDAAVQLSGRPSMMNPDLETGQNESNSNNGSGFSGRTNAGVDTDMRTFLQKSHQQFHEVEAPGFREQLSSLLNSYLDLKESLVQSDQGNSARQSREFLQEINEIEAEDLTEEARTYWEARKEILLEAATRAASAEELSQRREVFILLSEEMIKSVAAFGIQNKSIFVEYCPMANSDEGAYWLSEVREIKNPYYGEAMMSCGEVVKEL